MSYIKEVAEMLGVGVDEEFQLRHINGIILSGVYKITNEGVYHQKDSHTSWCYDQNMLEEIIRGVYSIVPKPWKPKDGEKYFFIACDGSVYPAEFNSEAGFYKLDLRMGNVFRTKEEAEANVQRWLEYLDGQPDVSWRNL